MKPLTYRLPDNSIPVLVSADTRDLLHDEAAALLSYATDHPEVAPQEIADMLFRTRVARRHRALAMVADRDELLGALRAVLDGRGTSLRWFAAKPPPRPANSPMSSPGRESNDPGWAGSSMTRSPRFGPR